MKPTMRVRVAQNNPNASSFQGVVEMPNLAATKLRKENGCTCYTTVSNLRQAAVAAAKKYGANLIFVEPKKFAAKRSSAR